MTIEEGPVEPPHHHLLGWLEDSISFLPTFLDEDPYAVPDDISSYDWWTQDHSSQEDHLANSPPAATAFVTPVSADNSPPPLIPQPEFSRKRKLSGNPAVAQRRRAVGDEGDGENEEEVEAPRKVLPASGRKGNGGSSGNGGNKEVRWAEQLLNPLATAIDTVNLNRVQHLLFVLHELASPSGDANHRLASHGLRALSRRLASVGIPTPGAAPAASPSFATTEPRLFRSALIKFHEVSPWFAFPNCLANAAILQALSQDSAAGHRPRNLHVVDIGVSHGIQWPTLLDALTRRSGGAPGLVKLTVAGAGVPPGPFSASPPGYDFPSHLLRYAMSIELNLRIDRAESLGAGALTRAGDEVLVVCIQFRACHVGSDHWSSFLQSVRELKPDLVVLSEIDGGGGGAGNFAEGFARRAEMLWRFLDSTSAAFKGRDSAERRVVEGEAARALEEAAAAEGRERWRERMVGSGFQEEGFGEEAVDAGRALLRKYDSNWEMKAAVAEAVGLWWKGQPVSFCSLWKPVT